VNRTVRHLLRIAAAASFAAASGCRTEWAPRSTPSPIPLQWPPPPAAARVRLVETITGFDRHAGTGETFRAIAIGDDRTDDGALLLPSAVAVGEDGRIAVADLGRKAVHLFVPAEKRYAALSGEGGERLTSPVGLAFGEAGTLFVTDSAGAVLAFAGDGRFRFAIRNAGGAPLGRPTGIAWSVASKLLFVADTTAHRIDVFTADGAFVRSFGRRGAGDGELNFPTHLFRSAAGELFVTDALNFRVQVFREDGTFLRAFGRHGDGSGDLASPKGIAVDRNGTAYLVDALFDAVQLFSPDGAFLLTVGRRGSGLGELWLPSGAFLDGRGRLYVCDTYNHRVLVYRVEEGAERG
jgi:DNA-binding beta-propeller fold protein YncE